MNSPARLWALAVPGILTTINRQDHALLGGGPPSPDVARDRAEVLRGDWGASNRAELLRVLDWLVREGHRKEFNDLCALDIEVRSKLEPWETIESAIQDQDVLAKVHFTRRHRERVGTRSLLAWDMVRLATLSGWGHVTGMLAEEEAWSYVVAAAQAVQRVYGSWEELGKHHLVGREFWSGAWDSRFARAFLALFDDTASPWRSLPWDVDLSRHGLTVPLPAVVVAAPPPPVPVIRKPAAAVVDEDLVAPGGPRAGGASGVVKVVAVAVLAIVGAGLVYGPRLLSGSGQRVPGASGTSAASIAAAPAVPSQTAASGAASSVPAPPRSVTASSSARPGPARPAKKR